MIINLALLVVALKILGVKFMVKTIYAIFTLYFLLKFAQMLMPVDTAGHYIKILGPNQDFMSLLIGCCFTGTALAVVFMNNGSTGGTDIIAACVNKYRDVSLGQVLMAVDFLIIGKLVSSSRSSATSSAACIRWCSVCAPWWWRTSCSTTS